MMAKLDSYDHFADVFAGQHIAKGFWRIFEAVDDCFFSHNLALSINKLLLEFTSSKNIQEPADEFANAVLCMLNMIQEQKSFSGDIICINIFLHFLAQNIWIWSIGIVVSRNLSTKHHV
jgi:hypothetical protein